MRIIQRIPNLRNTLGRVVSFIPMPTAKSTNKFYMILVFNGLDGCLCIVGLGQGGKGQEREECFHYFAPGLLADFRAVFAGVRVICIEVHHATTAGDSGQSVSVRNCPHCG